MYLEQRLCKGIKGFYIMLKKFTCYVMIHSLRMIEMNADCDVKVNYDVISYKYR